MKDGFVRVAALTPKVTVGAPEKNAIAAAEAAACAVRDGARIGVFPHLFLTGCTCADLFAQQTLIDGASAALLSFAEATRTLDALFFIGLPVAYGGRLFAAVAAVAGGRVLGVTPARAPATRPIDERRHFAPAPSSATTLLLGGERVPFGTHLLYTCEQLPALTVAPVVGADMYAPIPTAAELALAGATLLVHADAHTAVREVTRASREAIDELSRRLTAVIVSANATEGESTTDHIFGAEARISVMGASVAARAPFAPEAEALCATVDLAYIAARRRLLTDATPSVSATVIPFSLALTEVCELPTYTQAPFLPPDRGACEVYASHTLKMQAVGLAARLERARARCAVIGLSGGLDSTLALLVAVRAADRLGWDRTRILTVTMPCFGTTTRTKGNAERLAEALGVTLRTVDVRAAVEQHFADIGHDPTKYDLTFENAQARERTQVLMDIAGAEGGLVVGTGDLSELALGWATYNGDHMSMYGVNAGVPKTLVRHLVAYEAAAVEGTPLAAVLSDILDTPVSPELLPAEDGEISQCTEGIVGPYELHDFFLYHLLTGMYTQQKLLRIAVHAFRDVYDESTVRRWLSVFLSRFFTQQFKRSCLPDGPQVTPITLSPRGGLVLPSDMDSSAFRL